MDPYHIVQIVALVLINWFFVAAEFAIVKVRQSQLDIQDKQWNRVASLTKHITTHLDTYLSTTQLGITLTWLGLWWMGGDVLASHLTNLFIQWWRIVSGSQATFLITGATFILITAVLIIFGELTPKALAIRYPLWTSLLVSRPIQIFYIICRPAIWILNTCANMLLKLFGISQIGNEEAHTEDELRILLTESEEHGTLQQSSNELIQNVFEFDDRLVKQVYVPKNKTAMIDMSWSVDEIMKYVIQEWYSRYPVYHKDDNDIIGILHTKDLLTILYQQTIDKQSIRQMIRSAMFVPLTQKIQLLLQQFQQQHQMIALVTNEFGEIVGLVTVEDLVEELIWEIQDEHDNEVEWVIVKDNGEYIVQWSYAMLDLNDHLPVPLPLDPNYETVAGFVQWIFGSIPQTGESITYQDYQIKIIKTKKHMIESIKIKYIWS